MGAWREAGGRFGFLPGFRLLRAVTAAALSLGGSLPVVPLPAGAVGDAGLLSAASLALAGGQGGLADLPGDLPDEPRAFSTLPAGRGGADAVGIALAAGLAVGLAADSGLRFIGHRLSG